MCDHFCIHIHLLYRQCVYKRDSSVYLDGHLLFSKHEAILTINMEITKITKGDKRD